MKGLSTQMLKAVCLGMLLLLSAGASYAAVYTAVQPGNYTDPNTWAGPNAPPVNVTNDDIQIIGVFVTLDTNISFSGSNARLEVTGGGGLSQDANPRFISFVGSQVAGNGNIDVDSMYADFSMNGFDMNGSVSAAKMEVKGLTANQPSAITVSKMLHLTGTLDIGMGVFDLGSNSIINVAGGNLAKGVSGNINLVQPYDLNYITTGTTTGLELNGPGMQSISVDVGSGNAVMLSEHLVIDNNIALDINSGTLDLNGNRLVVTNTGDITGSNTADAIDAMSPSSITINKPAGITRTLSFATGATVDSLHVNMTTNTSVLDIASGELKVAKVLWLQDGMIDINDNKLTLIAGATIVGGDMDNYIIATGNGRLVQDVGPGDLKYYPVGTAGYFAPASITGNTGHSAMQINVGVENTVYSQGTTGFDFSASEPLVDNTWHITGNSTGTPDVDIDLVWAAAQEVNNFDRSKCYVSYNSGGSWVQGTPAPANAAGGMYGQTISNAKSLNAFAVFDNETAVSVAEVNAKESTIAIYPNPVTDVLRVSYNGAATATVYSATGQVMSATYVNGSANSVDVSALPAGMYYLHLTGDDIEATQRFVKQ